MLGRFCAGALHAALRFSFGPPSEVTEELKTLLDDIVQLSGRRNDIAHGVPVVHEGHPPIGIYLQPHFYSKKSSFGTLYHPDAPLPFMHVKYSYTGAQILGYA